MKTLKEQYFDWMCGIIDTNPEYPVGRYRRLLEYLHSIEFRYILQRDSNRYEDGIDLRYRFAYDENIGYRDSGELDNDPCSVLEMLVAMLLRGEEGIMYDPDIGYQTGSWFFDCIRNLGLIGQTDDRFDVDYVEYVVNRFLDRQYERDGSEGGIFVIHDSRKDMRNAELWYQMMWYYNEHREDY